MYVDGVQLYISCLPSDITNCIEKINCDLHNVFQWMSINGLCLNPRKSKALILVKVKYKAQISPLQINNTTVEVVHNVKNLGVIFNNSFNWSNHVTAICAKTVAMLRSLWQYFTLFNIRMLLVKTNLIPTLLYGYERFSSFDSGNRNNLKVTYNSIARCVYGRTGKVEYLSSHIKSIIHLLRIYENDVLWCIPT